VCCYFLCGVQKASDIPNIINRKVKTVFNAVAKASGAVQYELIGVLNTKLAQ